MSLSVESVLKKHGPCLSSRVAELIQESGLSAEAARQRVSRAKGAVQRLAGISFPKGARFMYLEKQYNTVEYWGALTRDLSNASPAYGAAVAAMQSRGGIVLKRHFDICSGSPLRQKGQISSATVLARLTAIKLLSEAHIEGIGDCVVVRGSGNEAYLKARLVTESIQLLAVRDWAKKLGFASANKIVLRDDENGPAKVGTFVWDLAGPCYLKPLIRRAADGKPKPGFLVCDIAVGSIANVPTVNGFIRKCQMLSAMKRLSPLMPIMMADGYTPEALRLGRSQGLIMATPENLFGIKVAQALAALLTSLTKAAAVAVKHPEIVIDLFETLGKIEGAAGNLRGALFELIVGHCVVAVDGGSIDIGKKVYDPETKAPAEIDVLRVFGNQQQVWAYECKGHQPTEIIELEDVRHWLEDRVSVVHKALSSESRFFGVEFHYEYWTCGKFSDEAKAFLETRAAAIKKYRVGWKDGGDVRAYVAKAKSAGLKEMFDQHYLKHPLARIDQKYDASKSLRRIRLEEELDGLADATPFVTGGLLPAP